MTNAAQLTTVLKMWEQISTGWNDEKSALIEKQYLEPLMTCSLMIANKISEANEFISMVEKDLNKSMIFRGCKNGNK